jgi:hypothetical protein
MYELWCGSQGIGTGSSPVAEARDAMETCRMEPDPLCLELELRRAGDPIEGRLSSGRGEPVSFIGWLELIAAVEAARTDDDRERGVQRGDHLTRKGRVGTDEAHDAA